MVLEVLVEPCFEEEKELPRLAGAELLRLVGAELLRLVGADPLRFEPVELDFEEELLRFGVMTIQFGGSVGFVANHLG